MVSTPVPHSLGSWGSGVPSCSQGSVNGFLGKRAAAAWRCGKDAFSLVLLFAVKTSSLKKSHA